MDQVKVIKVFYCIYGNRDLQEDEDYCMVHNSKRIPKQEICEEVKRQAIEELKKREEQEKALSVN